MTRPIKRYVQPPLIAEMLEEAETFEGYGEALENPMLKRAGEHYRLCAETLDAVVYDIFKTKERYHVIVDHHGPLYHVEVMDIIAKLEKIQEIISA